MSLLELVNDNKTDKNTVHSYLPLYQKLLESRKETAKNVLEVGMLNGGSIKLWNEFFVNATIHGVDVISEQDLWDEIKNKDNIILHTQQDAYVGKFVENVFEKKGVKFDFILDDGPHTLESMKQFIHLYSKVMTDDGILIVEDVQDPNWFNILYEETPNHLKQYISTYDLRGNKNRYDDLVFVINKNF